MTQLAGVTDSRDIVGMAEDIENAIFDISPAPPEAMRPRS